MLKLAQLKNKTYFCIDTNRKNKAQFRDIRIWHKQVFGRLRWILNRAAYFSNAGNRARQYRIFQERTEKSNNITNKLSKWAVIGLKIKMEI